MCDKEWAELEARRREIFEKAKLNTLQKRYIFILATRVTELCNEAIELLNMRKSASIPIILRSALESYIDLKCTIKNENHIIEMNKAFEFYLSVKENKKEKVQPMKISNKFKLADEAEAYSQLYADLCLGTHGNIAALVQDHAQKENIYIGHTTDPQYRHTLRNHTFLLAAKTLIDAAKFLDFSETNMIPLIKIRDNALNGQYIHNIP